MNHDWNDVNLLSFKYDSERNCVKITLGSVFDEIILAEIEVEGIDLLAVDLSDKLPLFIGEAYLGDLTSEKAKLLKKFAPENTTGIFVYLAGGLIEVEILAKSYVVSKVKSG